jgi:hypothetical protein
MLRQNSQDSLAVEALKVVLQQGGLPETMRLTLRLCCKQLREEATKTLTRARFTRNASDTLVGVDQFVLRGWPNSLEHLVLFSQLSPADLIALASAPFPKLQTLKLCAKDYKPGEEYPEQTKNLFCVLAHASSSWPLLRSLEADDVFVDIYAVKFLLQGTWSAQDLRLRLEMGFEDEDIMPDDWSTAFPNLKELTLRLYNECFPRSIAQANLHLERLTVYDDCVEENGFDHLSSASWLKELRHLELTVRGGGDVSLSGLMSAVQDSTTLTSLKLVGDPMPIKHPIPSLENLMELTLEQTAEDAAAIIPLRDVQLPKLQYLKLYCYTFSSWLSDGEDMMGGDGDEEFVWGDMPQLRTLVLIENDETKALNRNVASNILNVLPQLRNLVCSELRLVGLMRATMLAGASREDSNAMRTHLFDIYKGSTE